MSLIGEVLWLVRVTCTVKNSAFVSRVVTCEIPMLSIAPVHVPDTVLPLVVYAVLPPLAVVIPLYTNRLVSIPVL